MNHPATLPNTTSLLVNRLTLNGMEPLSAISRRWLMASMLIFAISTAFTAYLAWSLKQPSHPLLDSFKAIFNQLSFEWIERVICSGIGLFSCYLAVDLRPITVPYPLNNILRRLKKMTFSRCLLISIFFSFFGGFLFGPGLIYSIDNSPQSFAYIAFGLYCLIFALLFVRLPAFAVLATKALRNQDLPEAIFRMCCFVMGAICLISAVVR